MKREFYLQDEKSNKFWTVEVAGAECVTTHGRIGSTGRETRKDFGTKAAAEKERDKLIAEKTKKGYIEGSPPK